MRIPFSGPDIGPRRIQLVNQVLGTPYLSMGPMIERFERLTGLTTLGAGMLSAFRRHGSVAPLYARSWVAAG